MIDDRCAAMKYNLNFSLVLNSYFSRDKRTKSSIMELIEEKESGSLSVQPAIGAPHDPFVIVTSPDQYNHL
jgi:hypothetical protein